MKKIILSGLFCALLLFSCKKDKELQDAMVIDMGDPAIDGCGWVIRIAAKDYKPENLATDFQTDSLAVKIKYTLTGSMANCGRLPEAFDKIRIDEIQKK